MHFHLLDTCRLCIKMPPTLHFDKINRWHFIPPVTILVAILFVLSSLNKGKFLHNHEVLVLLNITGQESYHLLLVPLTVSISEAILCIFSIAL